MVIFFFGDFYLKAQEAYEPAKSAEFSENDSSFTWTGEWIFEQGTDAGKIVMTVKIIQDRMGYKGWHCMTDGRILGGASDCADFTGSTPEYTLRNSVQISSSIQEFDFISGYITGKGKARLIKVDNSTIRFIVTEPPAQFKLSPLANYLFLNEGIGADASGGIELTK